MGIGCVGPASIPFVGAGPPRPGLQSFWLKTFA